MSQKQLKPSARVNNNSVGNSFDAYVAHALKTILEIMDEQYESAQPSKGTEEGVRLNEYEANFIYNYFKGIKFPAHQEQIMIDALVNKCIESKGMVEKEVPCSDKWHVLSAEEYAIHANGGYPRSCPACHSCFNPEFIDAPKEGSSAGEEAFNNAMKIYDERNSYSHEELIKLGIESYAKLSAKPELVPLNREKLINVLNCGRFNADVLADMVMAKFSAPPSRVPSEELEILKEKAWKYDQLSK